MPVYKESKQLFHAVGGVKSLKASEQRVQDHTWGSFLTLYTEDREAGGITVLED